MTKGPLLTALFAAFGLQTHAQDRAATCFLFNDFEQSDALNGWDIGPAVERRSPEGSGLGEFVPAWVVGDAGAANAEGYFPVTDQPVGNRFVMANDAAAPCNCDLSSVSLTTPVIDLSGRTGVALEFRLFHEGLFDTGPVFIETSVLPGQWTGLAEVAPVVGAWQQHFIDLGTFDGWPTLKVRFRWSDGGAWAGGIALDDICFRERLTHDLIVSRVQTGSSTASPFALGDQTLFYRQLPLSQAEPLTVSAMVKNGGTLPLEQIGLTAVLDQNGSEYGPFNSTTIDTLLPGETREVTIPTGWQPTEAGLVTISVTGASDQVDDAPQDDQDTGTLLLTAPGWDLGYSAMACDDGVPAGSIGGSGGFIVSNRMEIARPDDHAIGVSVVYSDQTQAGAVVRAILMDANFTTLDTSVRRTLEQADMEAIWNGLPLYEAFTQAPLLEPGDYHVGIQQLTTNGDLPVHVAVGGGSQTGRSTLQEGLGFTLQYVYSTPLVRLHLAEVAVGLSERPLDPDRLRVWPNPAHDAITIGLEAIHAPLSWSITDATGRIVRQGGLQGSTQALTIDVDDLPNGAYQFSVQSLRSRSSASLVVID